MGHCGDGRCLEELCRCACDGCVAEDVARGNDAESAADREALEAERRSIQDELDAERIAELELDEQEAEQRDADFAAESALEKWARRYDALNGAPEGMNDR